MTGFSCEVARKQSFISLLIYALLVLGGLLLGTLLLVASGTELIGLVRALPSEGPSAFMLFVSLFLPLGITYLSLRGNRRMILFLLVLVKSAMFFFSAVALLAAFPRAGWLVQLLVLFSGWSGMLVYHWLWLRCLVFQSVSFPRDIMICLIMLIVILLCDLLLVCPFTALLFIHK